MDNCNTLNQIIVRNIRLPITCTDKEAMEQARKRIAPLLHNRDIARASVFKRSLDARRRQNLSFLYTVMLETEMEIPEDKLQKYDSVKLCGKELELVYGSEKLEERPVICGFGPCGMFCALLLAENGFRPIVIERGGDIQKRAEDVGNFYRSGILNPESNIQFGAGGAGTFSDGKLVTRINDSRCRYVLNRFAEFGAPEDILIKAKPHIGTDKLRGVVSAIAARICELGGEIHYSTRLDSINTAGGRAISVVTTSGEIKCGTLTLAIGHSARDTYDYLIKSGCDIRPKPFSVGVRIEHLQADIDRSLFGDQAGNPVLGAGEYAFSKRTGEKAVYTFCMCPGGEVVAAASEDGGIVTNGMSNHLRNGVNANAAIAVSVESENPIEFQRSLERAAFESGGGKFRAPAQTVGDFLSGKSGTEPSRIIPTYMGGNNVRMCNLNRLLPEQITSMLKDGILDFNRKLPGFACPDAVLTGVETRTSAPVRIIRSQSMNANGYDNIYPCGEGAGYAGGITSAAIDGISCATEIIRRYRP